MKFEHKSVLLDECIENLNIKPDGIYVDGTMGGAGHAIEIAKRLKTGRLIGVDKDINAINKSRMILDEYKDRVTLVHDDFSNVEHYLELCGVVKIDGFLLDLGVSSHQLDEAERGFSYMQDAALDMRMDNRQEIDAKYILNNYTVKELDRIIKDYGEERWSKRIAEFIEEERKTHELKTTFELVDIIKKAIPKAARQENSHPAKRTFQAIRIEVNNELGIIEGTINKVINRLNTQGRVCIISFHSLEDRIVKNVFKTHEKPCICPKDFPMCMCNRKPDIRLISHKPILPSADELVINNRAHSAKLRVAEKII